MLKARLPGPGTQVIVYGDSSGICRRDAHHREWRVVAEVEALDSGDVASWDRALRHLLEYRARVLMVPGPETVGFNEVQRDRRIRDVALHHARLFYSEVGAFPVPPAELTRARRDS